MRPRFGKPRNAFALAFAALALAPASGRAPAQSPTEDRSPLARYVPKDGLMLYVECDGVDAHADAWRKTAAYKILNETPTGAMLEDLLGQLATKLPQLAGKVSGPEAVAVVKHLARSGFVMALGGDAGPGQPPYAMIALRDAFKSKEVRPAFARALQGMNAPNTKPQAETRAGHKVIVGKMGGTAFSWWIEESKKEDLIVVLSPDPALKALDVILEALDGKRPGAIEHPSRVEVSNPEGGFTPVLRAFASPNGSRPGSAWSDPMTRLDLKGGFQDDALTAILRVSKPRPHAGLLALLDGPSFDRSAMPAMPEGLTSYSVLSMNVLETFDKVLGQIKQSNPAIEDQVKQAADSFKAKTKLRLREDLLAHLGPRMAWYVMPAKSGTPPTLAAPTALGMGLAMMGIDQVPKAALVIDIDNTAAFGRALDELMAYVNREIKASPLLQAGPPGAEAGPARGGRNRGSGGPSVEFRLSPGETKGYVLAVPPEFANRIPAAVRPTIRVAGKQVILAMSPEVARAAQEAKGPNAPPSELASAFAALPSKLRLLALADPRDTLPAVLAALPGKLQAGVNKALLKENVVAPVMAAPAAPATPAGSPAISENARRHGASGESGAMPGPTPAAPGPTAGDAGKPAAGMASVVLQVDPAKLPSADAVRSFLFPSMFSIEEDGDGFKITLRQAFPDFGDPSKLGLIDLIGGRSPGPPGAMPPRSPTDGFFDIPPPSPPAAAPPPPAAGRTVAPGGRGRGGDASPRPE